MFFEEKNRKFKVVIAATRHMHCDREEDFENDLLLKYFDKYDYNVVVKSKK